MSTWMFDSNFLHWWCQRALQSHKQSQEWAEEGVAESCLHHPTATALPVWRRDWPWELRGEQRSHQGAGDSCSVGSTCGGWASQNCGLRTPYLCWLSVVFFVYLVNMFLKCSVKKKKNHLSNLNSVNKQGVHMLLTSCRRAPWILGAVRM